MKILIRLSACMLAASLAAFTPLHQTAVKSKTSKTSVIKTTISWKSTEIKLGEITQNKPVTIEFEFTNTGDNPVLIKTVQAGCGCTSTNYSKTPVLPGETTKISAIFNAAAKGVFNKQITVVTSAEETPQVLTFNGTVI